MKSYLATITYVGSGTKELVLVEPLASTGLPGHELPGGPVYPGQGLPNPPIPGHDLPGFPGHPSQGLPGAPGHPAHPLPPLPPDQAHPGHPIVLPPMAGHLPVYPAGPDNTLPGVPPGTIYPPLPPEVPKGKAVVLVFISGVGTRWAVIDTSLTPGTPLPGSPAYPSGQPVPPLATPSM